MTISGDDMGKELAAELDRWHESGRQIRLWVRDDDAIAASPALDRLSTLAERRSLPVLLAVIPMLAEPSLATALRSMPLLLPCQHGTWHRNHAPAPAKKAEFGASRSASDIGAAIETARLRLRDMLGTEPLPVFVPPWNRIDPAHAALLPGLGFTGLSCFRGYRVGAGQGPVLVNTDLDIMDWKSRTGRQPDRLLDEACRLLAARRIEGSGDSTFGLLLHHRDHDETAWTFLDAFLTRATAHPAVAATDPRQLFKIDMSPTSYAR